MRAKIIDLCRGKEFEPIGQMGVRKDSPSYEIFDTHKEVEGNTLRFIAYRCTGGKNNRSLDYYQKVGSKKIESLFGKFRKKRFNCDVDARNDILTVLPKAESFPYKIDYKVVSETHPGKRKGRGRPKKGEPAPPDVTEWRVDCTWEFDNALAERMAEDYNVRVIVTSVPKAEVTCDNPGNGATGKDILKLYLNQYVVEHSFREYKSGVGADTLFFQSTARMEVLLFLIALGTIIRNLVKILLRRDGSGCKCIPKNVTALKLFRTLTNMLIEFDPVENSIVLDGDEDDTDLLLVSCEVLGLEPERLLG
ncbi:MAG: hypothetical protein MJZ38_03590 [archaeon]|nr:hypothetical protein [archaeon]